MAVEKIQATDSLNDGRVKLNAAIEQSNEAITKATTADENASQAVTTANSVQEQFNQVVIEGDSSVEAAQARVSSTGTTYTTLKERLDTEHESVTTQLAQTETKQKNIALDLKVDFNVDVLNASSALQQAIDYAKVNGFTKIKLPPDNYYFDTPVFGSSNIELDFTGCKLFWKGTTDLGVSNGVNREYGLLNFWGTQGDKLPDIVSFIPRVNAQILNSKFSVISGLDFGQDMTTILTKGDFLELNIDCGWNFGGVDDYRPIARKMTRVVGFQGNIVLIDYSSPFNWKDAVLVSKTAYKVTPVKNVTIKGFNYEDITGIFSGNPTNVQRQSWVAGVSLRYAHNVKIEEFNAKGHKFPSIMTWNVHTISIKDFYASDPSVVSAGCGYGIQLNNATFVNLENIYGNDNRHLIDFSSSAFCNIINSAQPESDQSLAPYDCHGIGEHHISFINTIGTIYFGNGFSEFPMMISDVTINNHTGVISSTFSENVKITNSDVFLYSWTNGAYWNSFTVENSKVKIHPDSFKATTRGGVISKPYFKFVNCSVTLENRGDINIRTYADFTDYEMFCMLDCELYDNVFDGNVQAIIQCNNVKYITVKGGRNFGVSIQQYGIIDNGILRIQDIDFIMEKLIPGAPTFISIQPTSNGKFTLIYDKNTLINNAVNPCRWLRMGGTPTSYTITCNATVTDNHFILNIDDLVSDVDNFKWSTHGNYLDGLIKAKTGVLSKGILMTSYDKVIKRIGLDNSGNIIATD